MVETYAPEQQNQRILAIALAAVLFGAAGAFAKLLFTVRVSPLDLTAIRTIVALLVFALFLMATSRSSWLQARPCQSFWRPA